MFDIFKGADATAQKRKAQAERRKKLKEAQKEDDSDKNYYANLYGEDDDFYKKWAGPVLIGPIFPAMMCLLIIFAGQLVINSNTGTCGYDLASYISAEIAVAYLFLLVFSWVYFGHDVHIRIKAFDVEQHLLAPFKSLKWIMGFYLAIGGMWFIVGIVGIIMMQLAIFCVTTAPLLYQFSLFLVCIHWIFFFIGILYSIKLFFGSTISKYIQEQTREESMEEVEERVFRKQFAQFDPETKHLIAREDFPKLLQILGIFVPDEEIAQLMDTLDAEKTGFLSENVVFPWFKEITKEDEQTDKKLENVSDEEDEGSGGDDE